MLSFEPSRAPVRDSRTVCFSFVAGMVLAASSLANAQTPAAPAAPAAPAVAPAQAPANVTTSVHGDWLLKCVTGTAPSEPAKVCEIVQTVQLQGQNTVVAQIALGRVAKDSPLKLTLVLPPNVSFPAPVQILVDDKPGKIEVPWRRCVAGGCIADMEPGPQALQTLRTGQKNPRILFNNAAGQQAVTGFSLNGFGAAQDALAKAWN